MNLKQQIVLLVQRE